MTAGQRLLEVTLLLGSVSRSACPTLGDVGTPDAASPVRPAIPVRPAGRTGRPFDHSGDALILASTLDLLAERDYERVTLDEVAARTGKAKTTLYRRWATKED